MELWIARDKDGRLALYKNKPLKREFKSIGDYVDMEHPFHVSFVIDKQAFPEVTWENSPKKVRIELMETEK